MIFLLRQRAFGVEWKALLYAAIVKREFHGDWAGTPAFGSLSSLGAREKPLGEALQALMHIAAYLLID
jgi:hypothetical protein